MFNKLIICILIFYSGQLFSDTAELSKKLDVLSMSETLSAKVSVYNVYEKSAFKLVWDKQSISELVTVIKESHCHGLSPAEYHYSRLSDPQTNPEELDILATDAYLSLSKHILVGKVNPLTLEPNWTATNTELDLATYLLNALKTNLIEDSIKALCPLQIEYQSMKQVLENSESYSEQELNQIKINMERWRWLPRDLGAQYILINIAAYKLSAIRRGRPTQEYKIIVGRTYRQTPVFSNELKYLVLNPWWEVPHNIARIDLLPKFQKNPKMVTDLKYVVLDKNQKEMDSEKINWKQYSETNFPFRLRQQPGPQNALGVVKFMLPNIHNVYLHDTSNRDLFMHTNRTFSSGCIRVQDPLKLSEWVLQGTSGWSLNDIENAVGSLNEKSIVLKQKIPVHFLYFTIDINRDSKRVEFLEDIYSRDQRLLDALTSTNVKP